MPKEAGGKDETQGTQAAAPTIRPQVELNCGGRALRIFMLLANTVLLIFSIGILAGAQYNSGEVIFQLLSTWFTPAMVLGSFLLLLALFGGLGALTKSRCVLWIYILVMLLMAIIDLIVSSYALSRVNDDSESLVSDAFSAAGPGIRANLQTTFGCCGLNTYMDEYAITPCPVSAGANNQTGLACIGPMAEQFTAYGRGIPTFGLVLFFILLVVIVLAWWLIRSIAAAIRESRKEDI